MIRLGRISPDISLRPRSDLQFFGRTKVNHEKRENVLSTVSFKVRDKRVNFELVGAKSQALSNVNKCLSVTSYRILVAFFAIVALTTAEV